MLYLSFFFIRIKESDKNIAILKTSIYKFIAYITKKSFYLTIKQTIGCLMISIEKLCL